jgi:hypothetical protein
MSNSSETSATLEQWDDYRWLTSPAAEPWLNSMRDSQLPLTAQVAALRRELSSERTHLVLELTALRDRAQAKFTHAGTMFFTARRLEQATDEIVAAYKAQRFRGREVIFDLCTGIGGDLLALAAAGKATAFDRDPIMAILATANARACFDRRTTNNSSPICHARDVEQLGEQPDFTECSAWHIDPDRRSTGRRTTRVDLHEPATGAIDRLLARNPHAAIKLAPAAQLPDDWPERAELEWISRGRECRQLVAWFGDLAHDAGRRRATVLGDGTSPPRSIVGTDDLAPPRIASIGRYLFEPDAAVLAADLGPALAAEHDLAGISTGIAYWTGDAPLVDPALACFEVLEVLPFRVKSLASLLRARNIGQLEIKKRGVALDPAELRRQLRLKGDEAATLLLAPIAKRVTAVLARRVTQD